MAKPEWGTKRICQSCGAPFYDMRRNPIVCPKCGAAYEPENLAKLKRTRPTPVKPVPVPKVVEDELPGIEDDDDAVAEIDEDDEEEVLEDASDLEGDEELDEVVKKPEGEED